MKWLMTISQGMIPMIVLGIICCGACRKVDMYQTFIDGAKQGLRTVVGILPTLIGLMTAVGILRASGFMEVLGKMLGTVTERFGFPGELMPLTIVKMFSSSAATGLLLDIYKEFGTDSYIGRIASISMSCTETIFYTMSVYFLAAKVTKTRYTLAGALLATGAGLAASVWLAGTM